MQGVIVRHMNNPDIAMWGLHFGSAIEIVDAGDFDETVRIVHGWNTFVLPYYEVRATEPETIEEVAMCDDLALKIGKSKGLCLFENFPEHLEFPEFIFPNEVGFNGKIELSQENRYRIVV